MAAKLLERRHSAWIDVPGGEEGPIRSELFSAERLEQHAESLAAAQKVGRPHEGRRLMPQVWMRENVRVLLESYSAIGQAVREQRAITPAGEWLLDNFHVVEEQVNQINGNLPQRYYGALPKIAGGFLAGYPRVYGIAWALVAHTDSDFAPTLLTRFVRAYQHVEPLTIGELWAVPIALRLVMLENLRRLAVLVVRSLVGRRLADEFIDRGEHANRSEVPEPGALPSAPLRQAFAVQLVQRLHDPSPGAAPMSLAFLDDWLAEEGVTLDEIVRREHTEQAAANITVRNLITSMRAISLFDWPRFVEDVSLVDECLRGHPGYCTMDFPSRDRYRHAIEELAASAPYSEVQVARLVVEKSRAPAPEASPEADRRQEPGYFLIGAGRSEFEQDIGFRTSLRKRLLRAYVARAAPAYLGSIGLLTLLLLALPLNAAVEVGLGLPALLLLALFAVFPASDMAVALVNRIVTAALPPRHLPRLELKQGVPAELHTFVAVPTMLFSDAAVNEQIDQLESHYLANPDGEVRFALLSDWVDAERETMPDDARLLEAAVDGIAALNARYARGGEARFFLFHRKRLWNPCERKWMGWERKRGKLQEFNRLLRGATDTSFLPLGEQPAAVAPAGVRYVITLDADTKLPIGSVRQLVGAAAHPLNRPLFDATAQRVVDGYGIFQPRITPTLPIRREYTPFQRVFSGSCGVDPYAAAVSDVYQDLFGEGTYTGKGLYDVEAFEAALAGRVPENTLLSHDLLESVFARCALVSDIELFEEFPSHAKVAASRLHRWTRGDWQLLPWIFGRRGQGIAPVGRWKMLDNLRRSLSAPGTFLTLVAAWTIPHAPQAALIGFVLMALALPALLVVAGALQPRRSETPMRDHLRAVGSDAATGLATTVVVLTLLAQQAWLMIDAIGRTLLRLFVTRRKLLSWVTTAHTKAAASLAPRQLVWPLGRATLLAIALGGLVLFLNPAGIGAALPFLMLWALAPLIAHLMSLPPPPDATESMLEQDSLQLRLIGRRIWRFFTTFVTADDHWLPPDNFQEDPAPVLARRSSPTNFGLYLLSIIAARDFGWIGLTAAVERFEATLGTLGAMPRLHGHFYNWYDTGDLRPLEPRYVSTVDSGNLAAHLLVLARACDEATQQPFALSIRLGGLADTQRLLSAALAALGSGPRTLTVTVDELRQNAAALGELMAKAPREPAEWHDLWRRLTLRANILLDLARAHAAERGDPGDDEVLAWTTLLSDDIRSHLRDMDELIPWIRFTHCLEARDEPEAAARHREALRAQLALETAPADMPSSYAAALEHLAALRQAAGPEEELDALAEALRQASDSATAIMRRLGAVATQARRLFEDMDFRFLYYANRRLFALGYRVADEALDGTCYDLLASEARLTSLIAIAKRDVPSVHWFHLGRRLTRTADGAVLLSWSGSMFEYLMPSLVAHTPRYSLLDQTCRLAVKRQIDYGAERGVPWGVSESAFNVRDRSLTYQYSDFGVPGLGMKRGLGHNLVIAPYATALAAMYSPRAAAQNFSRLEEAGALGPYGYYEALDFTPTRVAEHQRVSIVRCYMAHHQGMSLVALDNVVHDGVMRRRFHGVPLIQAAELLLQERIPRDADTSGPHPTQAQTEVAEMVQPPVRRTPSPMAPVPSAHLLSNGRYAVMVTAAGSGYSLWGKLAVTRWREDATRDCWGSYLYLRDVATGAVWSAGYQPTAAVPDSYQAVFLEDRAHIAREDGDIASLLEILVSAEDDAEIRRLSLSNKGTQAREVEVTSYCEIVLAAPMADIAHPAFSNLFVQTEYLPQSHGLIARRRQRSATDPQVWAAHVVAGTGVDDGLQYETDRARFVGRGRTLRAPMAVMDGRPLGNTVGAVLDPVFSLRTRVRIEPGGTARLAFATMAAASRDAVEALADKYHDLAAFDRVSALAWTHAQVLLHHLRIKPDEARLFQNLANRLLYADPALRPASAVMARNRLDITGLWGHSVSGDRPIVLLRVTAPEDRAIVEQLLRAHEYWRMKHLAADLVILNEKGTSYSEYLQTLLEGMVRARQSGPPDREREAYGEVFVLRADLLTEEEQLLLQTVARVVLASGRGTLAEQVLRRFARPSVPFPPPKATSARPDAVPATAPALEFFNGLGGFADDGREYVIVLNKGQCTPAPWVNVIANPDFGFMVSELGGGCSWCLNGRENQLTPWSNDPISDPPGEALYLRDEETGDLWSPTALPIRIEDAGYVIRHGQGYSRFEHASHGIRSELLQFVDAEDPVRISLLTLTNTSGRTRRLRVASYAEWVLGPSRTVTAFRVVTELDPATGAVFASNPLAPDFGGRIAFADLGGRQTAFTCDRAEFIGRNGDLAAPAALCRSGALSNRAGAGLDPCAALETRLELRPGERAEVVFLLGQGNDRAHAVELVKRHRAADLPTAFAAVKQHWDRILGAVQVQTPDRALDFMLNRWLLYQTLSCRFWARAAFYQAGGAFGFRDQLQDSLALAVVRPDLARAHLLRAAARQFVEGDVQHWWHPPSGRGVRTHFSDDRIWLPYVVAHYIKVTGDRAVLDETVPFLEGPPLPEDQEDAHYEPTRSTQTASLFEHCARALDVSLGLGVHGLPLIGSGDWNDGMNRVGHGGKGESVWLAWFLYTALSEFAPLANARGDSEHGARWREHAAQLQTAIEAAAWDGAWYRRGYFDDGTPLGSAASAECRIDSIAQSWGVISGAAAPERARRAMESVQEYLVRPGDDLVLLFTPPFDKTPLDPGYIKGYLPGVRENGGQYTHAAIWCAIAYAMLGEGDHAAELMRMLNPINRTATRTGVYAYKVEPYVLAADIYAEPPHVRRGGWTWYTGAAGWLYRAGIEWILGLRICDDQLCFEPCVPRDWRRYALRYQYGGADYRITVENPEGASRGVARIDLDGVPQPAGNCIPLARDGQVHQVRVVLGER